LALVFLVRMQMCKWKGELCLPLGQLLESVHIS